jgi:hypothetical protein
MSMYSNILEVAFRERSQSATGIATGEALAILFDCRQHLASTASSERGLDWSSTALANQIAYDLALIDVARCVGLACKPSSFDQPQRRRIELEHDLMSRGVRLGELDRQSSSNSE